MSHEKTAPPKLSDLAADIKYTGPPTLPPVNADCVDQLRKPYAPPAVLETGRFESLTLSCLHLPMGHDNCHPAMVRS